MAVKVNGRCVIVAGSPDTDIHFIHQTIQSDDFIICADGGYAYVKAAGIVPHLMIGDFDSYTEALPTECELILLNPVKDDTDTQHCVDVALERGYRDFLLLGATGGRLDHSIANLCVLEYLSEHGAKGILLSPEERIELLCKNTQYYHGLQGKVFSVFPFGCSSVTLSYKGAKYPLVCGTLTHSFTMGISNEFIANDAAITVHDGSALVIINLE